MIGNEHNPTTMNSTPDEKPQGAIPPPLETAQRIRRRKHRANGDKDARGIAKRRRNGAGTVIERKVERRDANGRKYIVHKFDARYYVTIDGVTKRKSKTLDATTIEEARDELAALMDGQKDFNRERELQKAVNELQGIRASIAETARREAEERAKTEAAERDERAVKIVDAWPVFVASKKRPDSGPVTLKGYRSQYAVFCEWCRAQHPETPKMRDFTSAMAEQFVDHLEKSMSRNRRNKYVVFLRMFWRVMRENPDAQITADPWFGIKNLVQTPDEVKHRELTMDELRRVAIALHSPELNNALSITITPDDGRRKPYSLDLRNEMILLFAIGIYSGLRLGDCATLDWSAVDLTRGIINATPRKTARKYQRRIIIPTHVALRDILSQCPFERRVGKIMPNMAYLYERNVSLITSRVQAVFRTAGIDTGSKPARLYKVRGFYRIEYAERNPDGSHKIEKTPFTDIEKARAFFAERFGGNRARAVVGFHSLRHTFAAWLDNHGVNHALVNYLTCHEQGTVEARYYHANSGALAAAVETIPIIGELYGVTTDSDSSALKATTAAASPMPTSTPEDGEDAAEKRFCALCGIVEKMGADELKRAAEFIHKTMQV